MVFIPKLNLALIALLGAGIVTGCSTLETRLADSRQADTGLNACLTQFEKFDQATAETTDGETAHIPGFPYLRVNRFLASFAQRPLKGETFDTWLAHLRDLDRQARRTAVANLPQSSRTRLVVTPHQLEGCAKILMAHDFKNGLNRSAFLRSIRVPDAYNRWAQIMGLYPLSIIPVRFGIMHLHDSHHDDFKPGPKSETLRAYAPAPNKPYDPRAVRSIFQNTKTDALGVLLFKKPELEKLFSMFAPIIEVDTRSADDRPGRVTYNAGGVIHIDSKNPVLYRRLAFTRYRGQTLVQLVYTVWFPARTPSGPFDIFSGKLDGLVWRVTLDHRGQPMTYDTIHPCGCYHLFFPVTPWKIADADQHGFHGEPPLAPVSVPVMQAGQRIHLRLKSATHYLSGVAAKSTSIKTAQSYRLAAADELRSLPHPQGRKSLYAPDGLIYQSVRPERFMLWPMGVPSAGAMRQWGHHATAFIGTRHFDDADLMERILTR